MSRNTMLPAALLVVVGCQAQFHSEGGQWAFEDEQLVSEPHTGFGDEQSVVEQTQVCPSVHWQGEGVAGWDAESLFDACVEQALGDGGAFVDDEGVACVLLEAEGEVEWRFEPTACDAGFAAGEQPLTDRVLFEVVALDGVSAHVDQWPERKAIDGLDLEPPGVLDETILVAEGEAFRLLEGAEVYLFLRLWDDAREQPAAWRMGDGEVAVDVTAGEVEQLDVELEPGWVGLVLGEGAEAELSLEIHGRRVVAGVVQAAAPDELASLELVVGYIPLDEGTQHRTPWAARAVVLDGDGRPVFGTPVAWDVSGEPLIVEAGPDSNTPFPGGDYAWVEDVCTPPEDQIGDRSSTLMASYGELSDSLELTWTLSAENMDIEADWSPDERCANTVDCGGCACGTSGGHSGGLAWVLGMLAGALGLRRRR